MQSNAFATDNLTSIQIPDDNTLDEHYITKIMEISTKGKLFTFSFINSGLDKNNNTSTIETNVTFAGNKTDLEDLIAISVQHKINHEETSSYIETSAQMIGQDFLIITEIVFKNSLTTKIKEAMLNKLIMVAKTFSFPIKSFKFQDLGNKLENIDILKTEDANMKVLYIKDQNEDENEQK